MTEFKRIQLGIEEFLLVAKNGMVFFSENGSVKKLEPTIDIRRRKDRKWSYYRLHVKKKYFYMHKLIATAWIPNPNDFKFIRHIDGNTLNNAVSNLEWVYNSHDVCDSNRMIDTLAFYCSLDRKTLSGQNVWIYDYFMDSNEIKIREMFQGQKLRNICKWHSYQKEGDKFETNYDELYENILSKIRRGVILPRVGDKNDNSLFNYCVRTFSWLCWHRERQFMEILSINSRYLAVG